jgi:hypothetical protein
MLDGSSNFYANIFTRKLIVTIAISQMAIRESGLQIWRVTANKFNVQTHTADKMRYPNLGLRTHINSSQRLKSRVPRY